MGFGTDCYCDPITIGGLEYNHFIAKWASICWYSMWRDPIGAFFGCLNIFFWLILSLPQYKKMYRTKSAAGLSFSMLLLWAVADGLGLLGLMFSSEYGLLFALTLFFTLNNTFASALWVYYDKLYPRWYPQQTDGAYAQLLDDETKGLLSGNNQGDDDKNDPNGNDHDDNSKMILPSNIGSLNDATSTADNSYQPPTVGAKTSGSTKKNAYSATDPAFLAVTIGIVIALMVQTVDAKPLVEYTKKIVADYLGDELPSCLPHHDQAYWREMLGFSLTCACALLNSLSRFPQVFMNHQRQTTKGLSLSFTVLQLMANISFFISRHLPLATIYNTHWLQTALPWCVSTGFSTACLVVILWQIYWYGNGASIKGRNKMRYAVTFWDRVFYCLKKRPSGVLSQDEIEDITAGGIDSLASIVSSDAIHGDGITRQRSSLFAVEDDAGKPVQGLGGEVHGEEEEENTADDEFINANTGAFASAQQKERAISNIIKSVSFISPIYGTTDVEEEELDDLLRSLTSLSFVKNLSFIGKTSEEKKAVVKNKKEQKQAQPKGPFTDDL